MYQAAALIGSPMNSALFSCRFVSPPKILGEPSPLDFWLAFILIPNVTTIYDRKFVKYKETKE